MPLCFLLPSVPREPYPLSNRTSTSPLPRKQPPALAAISIPSTHPSSLRPPVPPSLRPCVPASLRPDPTRLSLRQDSDVSDWFVQVHMVAQTHPHPRFHPNALSKHLRTQTYILVNSFSSSPASVSVTCIAIRDCVPWHSTYSTDNSSCASL